MVRRLRDQLLGFGGEAATIAAIQAVNFLVPLAALPLLSRGLGFEAFGVYATALVLSLHVAVVSDYTFSINGPLRLNRELALPLERRTLLAVSALVRLGLALLCLPVVAMVLGWSAGADFGVIASACAGILATAATPRWAMYARGRLRTFLIATAVSRCGWFVGVALIVARPEDLAPLLWWTTACQLLLAVVCWHVARPSTIPSLTSTIEAARQLLREDLWLFLATTATALVRDGAPLVLSVLHGPAAMSVYAVSDRVRVAAIGLSTPFTQSLFLRLARRGSEGGADDSFRATANMAVLVPVALGCLVLMLFAEPVVSVLAGPEYAATSGVLRVLLLAPPIVCFNAIIGTNTLLAEGEGASFSKAQLFSAAISTPLIVVLVSTLGIWGAAIATVAQEVVLAAVLLHNLLRTDLFRRAFSLRGANERSKRT